MGYVTRRGMLRPTVWGHANVYLTVPSNFTWTWSPTQQRSEARGHPAIVSRTINFATPRPRPGGRNANRFAPPIHVQRTVWHVRSRKLGPLFLPNLGLTRTPVCVLAADSARRPAKTCLADRIHADGSIHPLGPIVLLRWGQHSAPCLLVARNGDDPLKAVRHPGELTPPPE